MVAGSTWTGAAQVGPALPAGRTELSQRAGHRVEICLLGSVRILKDGAPISLRSGGKTEILVASLALKVRDGLPRDEILTLLWPDTEFPQAIQSLNTLVYSLRRILQDALSGDSPVLRDAGRYRLNTEAGVTTDVAQFDSAIETGERLARNGDAVGAIGSFGLAVELYSGDLAVAADVQHVLERERLRARFLWLHARLAEHHAMAGDFAAALSNALELLAHDPCREDAHRMAMRCYVRLGQRAQAMRQYRICREILALEFDALPEGATEELFQQIRLDPGHV
jgi:DNA-binding SARP family transcriptional activator